MKPTIALLFAILCVPGNTFAGELDPSPTQQKWFKHYAKQDNIPKPEAMLLNTKPEPDLTTGFTPLLNGKDLNDWEAIGGTCTFEVQDGAIRGGVRTQVREHLSLHPKGRLHRFHLHL